MFTKAGSASLRWTSRVLKHGSFLENQRQSGRYTLRARADGLRGYGSYLTRSSSVTVKFRRAEHAVSMLGSLAAATPLFFFRLFQFCARKSTSRAGVSRVSRTFLGPSSAERWHRAGRRYLEREGEEHRMMMSHPPCERRSCVVWTTSTSEPPRPSRPLPR